MVFLLFLVIIMAKEKRKRNENIKRMCKEFLFVQNYT